MKLNIIGGNDIQRSQNLSDNKCINLYPTTNDDGSIAAFYKVDGLNSVGTLVGIPDGAYKTSGGRAFYVDGTTLYELTVVAGVYTSTSRGTLTAGTYDFSDNGIEMIGVNGTDGWLFTLATNTLTKIKVITGTCTISTASPALVTKVSHGLVAGDKIRFSTTGTLPSPIVDSTTYYVLSAGLTADVFEISLTAGGTAINTSVTDTTTCTISLAKSTGDVTITAASPAVFTKTGHGLVAGDRITLSTTGTLPYPLTTSTIYTVLSSGLTSDAFQVAIMANTTAVNTSIAGSGTHSLATVPLGKITTSAAHNLDFLDTIQFSTTGTLPTGISAGTFYYVTGAYNCTFFTTLNDTYIGMHTSSPTCIVGSAVKFKTDGTLPTGISEGTTYYVVTYNGWLPLPFGFGNYYYCISATPGGAPLPYTTSGSGNIILLEETNFGIATSAANIYTSKVAITGSQSGTQSFIGSAAVASGTHTYTTLGYGFPEGATTVSYMNGRFICCEPGTQNFYVSEVLDGWFWDALNVQTVDSNPDYVIGQVVSHNELIVFCETSGEVFYDSGVTPTPFIRNSSGIFEVGCVSPKSIAKLDNTVFWLGRSQEGTGIVYRLDGYTPKRISTYSIEYAIQGMSDISDARAFSYQKDGHHFYVLHFPTGEKTYVLDLNTNIWHERADYYSVETVSLSLLNTPTIATQTQPHDIVVSSDGLFLYVTNSTSNTISQYSINQYTGQLTALSPATIATGTTPYDLKLSPNGLSMYVCNYGDNTVSQYSRNATTGLLAALSPATIGTGANPYRIDISSDGLFVYVCNSGGNSISEYSRNITTGALTLAGTFSATGVGTVKIAPGGLFAYCIVQGSDIIRQMGRNPTTGLLSELTPYTIATGDAPYDLTISADGLHCYVTNITSNDIYQYSINASTGQLTLVGSISTGSGAYRIVMSPDGNSVYVTNYNALTVSQYNRNTTTGVLTALTPATISLTAAPYGIAITPTGGNVYVTHATAAAYVTQYRRIVHAVGYERWPAEFYMYFNGAHLVTCKDSVDLYEIDADIYKNGSNNINFVRSFTAPQSEMKRVVHSVMYVDIETYYGGAISPELSLRWSTDGGNTWSTAVTKSIGSSTEYSKRVKFYRLGITKGIPRIYELSGSSNMKIVLLGAYLE